MGLQHQQLAACYRVPYPNRPITAAGGSQMPVLTQGDAPDTTHVPLKCGGESPVLDVPQAYRLIVARARSDPAVCGQRDCQGASRVAAQPMEEPSARNLP